MNELQQQILELQESIQNKRDDIANKKDEVSDKQKELDNFQVERDEGDYEDSLNTNYCDVDICGMTFSAGSALLELDPTAFRIGFNEWVDSLDPSDEDGYKDLETELEDLEGELSDLESELEELEAELQDLESELESD